LFSALLTSVVLTVTERDLLPAEYQRLVSGFETHALEHGFAVRPQLRHGFVATDGAQFIGAVSGLTDHQYFVITDLYVEKPYRRRGIGTLLLQRLEARVRAEGIRSMYTWTAEYEAPAFYRKHGFEVFAVLDGFYPTGAARVGLRRRLA
jgi:ribosomal protein S18 acetylase RimI-like enzyme